MKLELNFVITSFNKHMKVSN